MNKETKKADGGISKRFYAAVECSKGLRPPNSYGDNKATIDSHKVWAEKCYRMADALLKQEEM